jgi:glycosyltransferase involved in cell wall biosynthesis
VRIFIPVASRFLRPRTNTDWRYSAKLLPLISSYCPGLEIIAQTNAFADAWINFRYAVSIGRRFPLLQLMPPSWSYSIAEETPVFASDVLRRNFQAMLSYERYPAASFDLPVAWITSATDKEVWKLQGGSASDADRLIEWKWRRAERAARLIFTTQTAMESFLQQSSQSLRSKCDVIPFFLPKIAAAADISGKWEGPESNGNHLRFLFVGREARRKGLVPTLAALTPMLQAHPHFSLTIVSTFDDGPVDIPALPNITQLREVNRERVLELMTDSHLLVMPSSWESYGFVYIEAMSRGCVPLAIDRPVQRELLAGNGILVAKQDVTDIRTALEQACEAREELYCRARGGLREVANRHSSEAVAQRFYKTLSQLG